MTTNTETTTGPSVSSKAKDYLEKYDGPVRTWVQSIGNQTMKQILRRDGHIFGRNALFIAFFSRLAFSEEEIDPLESSIRDKILKTKESFKRNAARSQTLLDQNQITDLAVPNLPEVFEVKYASPIHKQFLDMVIEAEKALTLLETLWLEGLIEPKDFQNERYEIKKAVRSVGASVSQIWIGLKKQISSSPERMKAINTSIEAQQFSKATNATADTSKDDAAALHAESDDSVPSEA